MQLKAVRFGQDQHLLGFYREGPARSTSVVLFWNTGLWNRSGPHRLNTELAMKLSDTGISSFCFDVSALGDSGNRQGSTGQERTLADLADACDYLTKNYGFESFILFGVCSSAIDAYHFALREKRVVRLIMIDTFAYRIPQFYVHYYAQRVFSLKRWKNKLKKMPDPSESVEAGQADLFEGVYPDQEEAAKGLQTLVDRGVSLWVAFTGGFRHIYSYETQFADTFPNVNFKDSLQLNFYKEADHLFSIRSQRQKLFGDLNGWFGQPNAVAAPQTMSLNALIERWERTADPEATAIVFNSARMKYGQFREDVDRWVSALESRGIGPGDPVAVAIPRSPELIVGIVAVLKIGACYVPLDLGYPAERIRTVLNIAGPKLVLCQDSYAKNLRDHQVLTIEDIRARPGAGSRIVVPRQAHDPAYIIFTSGSTGTPKGVVMGHGALAQLILWQNKTYRPAAHTLQFSPIAFDVSFQEIFSTLSTAGTLVLIREEERLDPRLLLEKIQSEKVERIFLPYVALQLLAEAASRDPSAVIPLVDVFTAGEQLICTPEIRQLFTRTSNARLHNQYGPSETHVATAYTLPAAVHEWPDLPSIGAAIEGSACYILDDLGQPIKDDREGELYLAGQCVGEGYWGDSKRTAERFIQLNVDGHTQRAYKTGDVARWMPDGNIAFLGRSDDQVKIRGFRIELGEVEAALKEHPQVSQVVVLALGDAVKHLVAVLQLKDPKADWQDLSKIVERKLPEYMRPQRYVVVADIPRTPSGKIDRRELTKREAPSTPQPAAPVSVPRSLVNKIRAAFASILDREDLEDDPHFFESGGSSILAIKLAYRLEEIFKHPVSVVQIFENPRASQLQKFLDTHMVQSSREVHSSSVLPTHALDEPIAIIGMAARMPGAPDLAAYWRLLMDGKEGIATFMPEELEAGLDPNEISSPNYIRRRGILQSADCFDADFFNIKKAEAELIDPQQRVFLEAAYHALEDGGYVQRENERVGVFAGSAHSTYYIKNVLRSKGSQSSQGAFAAMLANDKDYLAVRVAFKLGLTGPALDIQTACSSSAVAIIQAVMSLRSGQCDAALAGGVAITVPVKSGYMANDGGMLSPTGQCRPFGKDADGTIFSDGVGVILLKPLRTAQRDGDRVYAVIRGIGISNDGYNKASFTAPSARGQKAAIEAAWKNSGLSPTTATFLECHGTATALGDPIEVEALKGVFAENKPESVALGSVKGNIGHTTAAAGVAGIIKSSLCLYHRQLAPTLYASEPNPLLGIQKSPFRIASTASGLPKDQSVLAAGVSSFGVGGTNAHIVLSSADQVVTVLSPARSHELICLSSRDEESLMRAKDQVQSWSSQLLPEEHRALSKAYLRSNSGKKRAFAILGRDRELTWKGPALSGQVQMLWTFPGQGTQAALMGQQLAQQQPIFQGHWQRIAECIRKHAGWSLSEIVQNPAESAKLDQTEFAQPAIFCTSLAMAYTLHDLQMQPDFLIGHSIGEIAAATYAGLWSEESACAIIVKRGQLMGRLPAGGMTAVAATEEQIREILHPELDIAAINAASSCVVAGPLAALEAMEQDLNSKSLRFTRLRTSHAFHSRTMNPIVPQFKEFVGRFSCQELSLEIFSTQTGLLLTREQARNPQFWADQLRNPVLFHKAVQSLGRASTSLLALEVGKGSVTSSLIKRSLPGCEFRGVPTLEQPDQEWPSFLQAIGEVWLHGFPVNPSTALDLNQQKPLWVPGYPFARKRYYIEPEESGRSLPQQNSTTSIQERTHTMSAQKNQRWEAICNEVVTALEECSGMETLRDDLNASFYDLGLDSLFLTQASLTIGERLGLKVSFRQMSEDLTSIRAIVDYAAQQLPADRFAAQVADPKTTSAPAPAARESSSLASTPMTAAFTAQLVPPTYVEGTRLEQLFHQQMDIMRMQMQMLSGQPQVALLAETRSGSQSREAPRTAPANIVPTVSDAKAPAETMDAPPPKAAFGAIARISTDRLFGDDRQTDTVRKFTKVYNSKTRKSKDYASQHRKSMADPRVVTGFRPTFKELVYPLVTNRSEGPYIWDIDGHRYIDMLNGFGSNFFGHAPAFIKEILHKQIDAGYEIGPQFHLVGETSELAAELTGHDRVAWCNTGSEAVLGCIRIARTVTGKKKIVSFLGSYHGINDEVIVRSNARRKPYPAAPGILPNSVENMLVLDYGTDESLAIIESEIQNLAAVLVEPVQSRRPEFVPLEFWRRLRQITEAAGVPLIFDEVITGFRYHPGGVQGAFGIQADLTSYGKVVGGGLPIGMIGGKKRFMDSLDGGSWRFGDESIPEVGVTYFAGTFVRHPLAIAAAYATLAEIKRTAGQLQKDTNARADRLCRELNAQFDRLKVPYHYCNFGSLMKLKTTDEKNHFAELLPCWLRSKGLHTWDTFPSFLTASHKDEHIDQIVKTFEEALQEMIAGGLFPAAETAAPSNVIPHDFSPPQEGARLGKTKTGQVAWFIEDPDRPGRYLQIALAN
ncbi:MAG TPA: amino acid adenylation domain-containing protein [Oligoflexus sp.]|uniref:polyketide synthase n=1 Tax=Oligoflexus sp. TaxID=1971216 RepID=UPI002D4DAD5C|nr:polyketide synthase [Oligoflexus sp.]HYX35620.1 amino acid adenylation domain-containing protein [Oligoflexus sp.]